MRRRLLLAALGASGLFALSGGAIAKPRDASKARTLADAPEKIETVVEVSVLHGTHEKRDPDPRIGNMPELREGPFARYESYALLSRAELPLSRGGKR